ACGIGLQSTERYEAGETLQVELALPPEDTRLCVPARVVRCREAAQGKCLLQLDFAGLGHDEQEILIRFILRRQGQFLQGLREQREERRARTAS
nr:PilZ domain-containing protein [Pseudomonadales bacterium]